jgi:ribonuclease HI
MLRNKETFDWNLECKHAFQELNGVLVSPPVLSRPNHDQMLYLYLAVADEVVSAALVKEKSQVQNPIYFVSKALQGSELNYQRLKKVAYSLLLASRRLRPYFQCYPITVRTNQPIRQVLHKPDLVARMMAWAIELSQYDISYEPRQGIKAQVLAEFLAKMIHPGEHNLGSWTIYVDGSSSIKGSRVGILIENNEGVAVEYSLKFEFQTSNNQAEYEACFAGIRAAKELGTTAITLRSDSQLVVSQIKGEYQAKEPLMQKYLALVKESLNGLSKFEIKHVPRHENSRADLLLKLASTQSTSALW